MGAVYASFISYMSITAGLGFLARMNSSLKHLHVKATVIPIVLLFVTQIDPHWHPAVVVGYVTVALLSVLWMFRGTNFVGILKLVQT